MTTYQDNKPTDTPQSGAGVKSCPTPSGAPIRGPGPAASFPAPNTPIGR